MQFVKKLVKQTFLYRSLQQFRMKKPLARWTSHDQEMLEFYSQFISPNALCFDVGANIGNRVKILLKLQAQVVAIEPQAECVDILKSVFGQDRRLTIVQEALGEKEGTAEIMLSEARTIASLSSEWIAAVKKSGRFSDFHWDKKRTIPMTTLDRIIEQYGTPAFIKIDVEGFEYQVIKGLTQPVKTISLEFTPEFIESTFNCLDHLQRLGNIRLNYSVGETMHMALENWVTHQEMKKILSGFKEDNEIVGDVYVQYQS